MAHGIDVSENNGAVDWDAVKAAGIEFAIIRLGYGRRHLDSRFFENVKEATARGIRIGVYYYSYALDEEDAKAEGEFVVETLVGARIKPYMLAYGIWFDMEDADSWKANHGMPDNQTITNMCSEFICECNRNNYQCGIYASLDWLENVIYTDQLAAYVPYWVAQWNTRCDWKNTTLWQYTERLYIDGHCFDGNISF